jgi:hypothetical protein
MKKLMFYAALLVCLMALPIGVQAYSVGDSPSDAIGTEFEGYGINVINWTPGLNSGNLAFDIFTDYPKAGITVGDWATTAADLFFTETYHGSDYLWALPLVSHGGFAAGTMYAVGSFLVSDDFDPSLGSYIYNHNVPVQVSAIGNNYGWDSFGGGSVVWNDLGTSGNPDWRIRVTTGIWEDDANASMKLLWGTATCGNDVIETPEPATMLLLGLGLVGVGLLRRKQS